MRGGEGGITGLMPALTQASEDFTASLKGVVDTGVGAGPVPAGPFGRGSLVEVEAGVGRSPAKAFGAVAWAGAGAGAGEGPVEVFGEDTFA